MENNNPLIHFDLTLDETNLILKSLSKLPYEEVFLMINKISQEAQKQIQTANQKINPPTEEIQNNK